MQHFHSLPYAVLGFYKILESAYPDGSERGKKLEQQVADLLAHDGLKIYQLREIGFDLNKSPEQIANFLYRAGRQAVAHANKDPTINPKNSSRPIFDGMRIMHYQSHDAQSCSLSPSPDG